MILSGKRKIIIGCIAVSVTIFIGGAYFFLYQKSFNKNTPPVVDSKTFPTYTTTALAQYDGTDEKLPIYIALDGYVYDVTPGREFYIPGGAYHGIAGKDASSELRMFGGGIIKEKYKIVGIFSNQ